MKDRGGQAPERRPTWWVFDRPLVTDWLFAWAVAISVAATAWPYIFPPTQQSATIVNLAFGFLWSLFGTSILLGCGREFIRGRRDGRPGSTVQAKPSTVRDRPRP